MTQLTYLEAIHATNAGTATVLQYLCPIGVLAYSCIKDRVAPTVSEIISMVLAIAGTFLIATHGQLNQLAITPKGLALGTCFCLCLCPLHHSAYSINSKMG